MSTKRKAYNLLLPIVVYAAAGLTVLLLVGVIGYVLVKGLPNVSISLLTSVPSVIRNVKGILPYILNTLYVVLLSVAIVLPLGVGAAVYLNEYAKNHKLIALIEYTTETLAGIPSIIYGLVGMLVFNQKLGLGGCLISGSLTLVIMVLPTIIRTTQESLKTVPQNYREGALGLGATKWQVVSKIVLPSAFGRIATGIVLAIGRAIGETAVVLYTMGQAINLPISPLDSGRPMTVHLYLLANDGINMNAAYGTALLLMVIILAFNLFARFLSRKRR